MARRIIGLIPAAGHATRWGGKLPFSKELYPIESASADVSPPQRVAAEHLVTAFAAAGIDRAFVVTRSVKWDIPTRLLNGESLGCNLAYVVLENSPSVPHSLVAAAPFIAECDVALGFPDIVFHPADAVETLCGRWRAEDCDLLLGLFQTDLYGGADMVELGAADSIGRIEIQPHHSELRYTWILALWGPRFTHYLADRVDSDGTTSSGQSPREELHLGAVMQAALRDGFSVKGIPISDGRFVDVGTPEGAEKLADVTHGFFRND